MRDEDEDLEYWAEQVELHPTTGGQIYDLATILLLIWPVTGGMWLLGSTRVWGWSLGLTLSFAGCALAFLRPLIFPRTSLRIRIPWSWWIFAGATVWVCARAPFGLVAGEARWDALKWASLCLSGLAWMQTGGRGERWRLLLFAVMLVMSVECFYAISGHLSQSRAVLWAERSEQYGMRASGTFLCPNHFANMLAMTYCAAAAMLLSGGAGLPMRLISVYYLALATPVLYWTESRSGWVSLLLGLGVVALLWGRRRGKEVFRWMLAGVPVALLVLALGAWFALPAVRARVGQVIENPETAFSSRMEMWLDAPAMIRARPAFGFGGGSYQWALPPYREHANKQLTYDYMHNEYLQLLTEQGWVGFAVAGAASLFAYAALLAGAFRARREETAALCATGAGAMTAMYAHAMLDFNFHIFPNPHLMVLLGGLGFGVWAHREGEGAGRVGGRAKIAAAGLAAIALAGLALSVKGGMGYRWQLAGDFAQEELEPEQALAAYGRAAAWDGWNWRSWLGVGDVKSVQAMWYRNADAEWQAERKRELAEEALEAYRESLRLNPGDMEAELGMARAEKERGNTDAALEHYRAAAAYQPRHAFYREQLGVQLRMAGRDAEALEVFQENQRRKIGGATTDENLRILERKAKEAGL